MVFFWWGLSFQCYFLPWCCSIYPSGPLFCLNREMHAGKTWRDYRKRGKPHNVKQRNLFFQAKTFKINFSLRFYPHANTHTFTNTYAQLRCGRWFSRIPLLKYWLWIHTVGCSDEGGIRGTAPHFIEIHRRPLSKVVEAVMGRSRAG